MKSVKIKLRVLTKTKRTCGIFYSKSWKGAHIRPYVFKDGGWTPVKAWGWGGNAYAYYKTLLNGHIISRIRK
jgi:hypothetical protein